MEGSKAFSKDFMLRHQIPTAHIKTSMTTGQPKVPGFSRAQRCPQGKRFGSWKGVIIPSSKQEAYQALESIMLKKEFGAAGDEVVIEEYLEGEELSFLTFSDGYTIRSLPPAQDHKRIYDGDEGPNTGGMGCYAPTKIASKELIDVVHRTIPANYRRDEEGRLADLSVLRWYANGS
jgi:phosphoribosylamine--glycine ligase/phosphoribosylformylglycinamidine cyclo-ligase